MPAFFSKIIAFFMSILAFFGINVQKKPQPEYPLVIDTGVHGEHHIQGIAVDTEKGYMYCSFTTSLLKFTLDGKLVGSVEGFVGHLGCISVGRSDRNIYGALEYINDEIGGSIAGNPQTNAFYIAIFDMDKITRVGMSPDEAGVMKAVYLAEAVNDYNATGTDKNGNVVPHKYGCSGIDGLAIGPMFGDTKNKTEYLFIDCGPYSDTTRDDNDNMYIQCYKLDELKKYAKPLSQDNLHHSGPEKPLHKLFCYTGNTEYGIQNLEYDAYTNTYFAAVYKGKKKQFPNYSLFAFDASVAPVYKDKDEYEGTITLKKFDNTDAKTGISGSYFKYGSTGLFAFGNGKYYFSEPYTTGGQQGSKIRLYTLNGDSFIPAEK